MADYKQLTIYDEVEVKRIWKRDKKGKFSVFAMSNEEKLFRENNILKSKIRSLERQLQNKDFQIEALDNKITLIKSNYDRIK